MGITEPPHGAIEPATTSTSTAQAVSQTAAQAVSPQNTNLRAARNHVTFKEATVHLAQSCALSRRETEILFLMIKGWSDQRIADELVISYHTIRSHVRHIYTKTEVHNREELLDKINDVQRNSTV